MLKANHSKAFLAVQECCERHCFARGATAKPEPGEEFDAIIQYMQKVCDRWYAMAYGKPAEQPSDAVQSAQG